MNTVSVIIPVESACSGLPVLDSLRQVDYPQDKIEIILSVGNWPSTQRNKAASVAKGDILYFFNRDTRVQPDIFRKMSAIMDGKPHIAGVGGADLTPEGNSYMQYIFGYAMGSYFAHWKMRARYTPTGEERPACENELLLSNMAVRKEVFLQAGGFNEKLYPNEENEMINRIMGMGYKFIYSPDIKIYRDRRKNVFRFMKQFYSYGRGRANQIRIEGVCRNLPFFIPPCFLLYTVSLLFVRAWPAAFVPLFVYLGLAAIDSLRLSFRHKKILILLPVIYLLMHFSYACGILSGFAGIAPGNKKGGVSRDARELILVKEMGR
jgi:GT2 family glycosyltransferase